MLKSTQGSFVRKLSFPFIIIAIDTGINNNNKNDLYNAIDKSTSLKIFKLNENSKEAHSLHVSSFAVWPVPYGCAQPFQPYKWFWISLSVFK